MSEKPGSIIGGMLLIAGSCIGAGMLVMPLLTGLAGFFPSLIIFFVVWAFMTTTGLILVEVIGWFPEKVNLISMVSTTLGKTGRAVAWVFYLFLFYALLVAYMTLSGNLFSSGGSFLFSIDLPDWLGTLFFVLLFGWMVYLGTRMVDWANRFLMVGKIIAFIGVIFFGFKYFNPALITRSVPNYALLALPLLVTSFGFHNMIPSITSYMKGDLKRVRKTILLGSLLTLFIYLIWNIIVLSIVPFDGEGGILNSLKLDQDASTALVETLGRTWMSQFVQVLAFFAVLTSFLAQSLGLVHFLADGLKIKVKQRENLGVLALTLLPPLIFSMLFPSLLIKALNFAGGICAVILFGILPVLMVWKGRHIGFDSSHYKLTGGRPLLIGIFAFALFVLFFQISQMVHAPYIPTP